MVSFLLLVAKILKYILFVYELFKFQANIFQPKSHQDITDPLSLL
ncbi:MAG: hypothetical protein RIT03_886 [Bacteroidota bacterium]|jgi:hypothetical protein